MDIRTLQIFRHLSGSLHFARTSMACNITPSALTRMIQRLEAEVGQSLFVRDNRSVELTFAGQAFKKYAEDVIQRWDRLQMEWSEDDVLRGEISLYCSVTAAYSILPDIIARYRVIHPKVQIKLETGDPAKSIALIVNRDVDVVIAALPEKIPHNLSFLKMITSPLVFIAPKRFPSIIQYRNGRIDWEKTPMILPDVGLSRERMDLWFARHQQVPNIYSRVAGHEGIIALVNLGCGIGLVPELVLEKSPLMDDMMILNDLPELPPYEIGLCTIEKNLSRPMIRALWDLAARTTR
ncbi:IlvY [Desulforapulum autotrophicum HRM2]|uniref:IlvY n=1 Tax=Desulforapulum autotrophicum (strain ATCC 43914 / DSM 3382 / VKM B-1955 / HRM2) TaxID=177437 RepID=C0QDE2_DESAH|nr:HTH-type transcriptional activator IlvY [Desulforapulum autotrophicum]ACN15206.1 IlvY [Desulforapulum autotrophicum HRM2]